MIPERRNEAESPSEAFVELVRAHRGRLSIHQRVQGARSLVAALAWDRAPRRFGVRVSSWSLAGLALAIGVLASGVATWATQRRATDPLSYTVDGGRVERNGFIAGDLTTRPRLHFSDGSELLLAPGSKASLASVDSRGARVALTEGSAHVDIVHSTRARWMFDAGPFLISVTGTAFTYGWKPTDEQLDVQMERGSVEVSGPLSDGTMVLRSGQHLTVRVRERETVIRDREDDTARASAAVVGARVDPEPPPAAAPLPRAVEARAGASSSARRAHEAPGRGWTAELAAGDFEGIVQQAERAGVDNCLAEVPSGDLAALADAARYGRHDQIARRALLAQRRRFPLSGPARDAGFLLGRLEEAEQNFPRAITWYDQYLGESPTGTYASEALGRKMNLTQVLSGTDGSRALAAEYVSRFPQGTYAARARALVQAP
jgi:hypothetical protein